MRDAVAAAEHIGRRLLQRLRARSRRHHDRAAAVGDEAAVAHRERMADHARLQHVLDGERLLLPGGRIELRPLPRRDRDRGEVLARGAVLMHVARGRERIGRGRQERLERGLVRIDLALRGLLAPDAALGRAVGDHRDIAQPGLDRGRRLRDVKLERRAAGHRGADEFRRDAEIFDQRHDRHALLRHGAEQPVDVLAA